MPGNPLEIQQSLKYMQSLLQSLILFSQPANRRLKPGILLAKPTDEAVLAIFFGGGL